MGQEGLWFKSSVWLIDSCGIYMEMQVNRTDTLVQEPFIWYELSLLPPPSSSFSFTSLFSIRCAAVLCTPDMNLFLGFLLWEVFCIWDKFVLAFGLLGVFTFSPGALEFKREVNVTWLRIEPDVTEISLSGYELWCLLSRVLKLFCFCFSHLSHPSEL